METNSQRPIGSDDFVSSQRKRRSRERFTVILAKKYLESGFLFDAFGRYQLILSFIFLMISIYYGWPFERNFSDANESYCIDPPNVNVCSPKCKLIGFRQKMVDQNFVMLFHWICDNKPKYSNVVEISGVLVGIVYWHAFCQRYRVRSLLIVGFAVDILSSLLLVLHPTEVIYWMQLFLNRAVSIGLLISSQTLLTEFVPIKHYRIVVLIKTLGTAFNIIMANAIWRIGRHWRVYYMAKVIFCLIMLAFTPFVWETPRYYLEKNDVHRAVKVTERILTFNKEDDSHVQSAIQRIYIHLRSHKINRNVLIGLWGYKRLRAIFIKYVFLLLVINSTMNVNLLGVRKLIQYLPFGLLIGLVFWLPFARKTGKTYLQYGFFIVFYFMAHCCVDDEFYAVPTRVFCYLCANNLGSQLKLYGMEILPACLMSTLGVVTIVLWTVASKIVELFLQIHKAKWLPVFVLIALIPFCIAIVADMLDSRLLPYRYSMRDAEADLNALAAK